MPTEKITKQTVDAAKPRATRYIIFDSIVPGFGLRVFPSGAKSWIFEYRPGEAGRSTDKKRVTIGNAGGADGKRADFTPAAAREAADRLRAMVKTGGDPQGEKAARRQAPTVKVVADAFMDEHVTKKRGAATVAFYRSMLDRVILPRLGSKKAKDVTGRDVSSLHQAWGDTPYQANRALAVLGAVYSWAAGPVAMVPEGMNPTQGIERFAEERRGRVLSADELEQLGVAVRTAETTGVSWQLNPDGKAKHRAKSDTDRMTVIGAHAAAALRLLIFTGMRLREVLHLRWDQVDLEQGLIVLEKHKTSRKTGIKAVVLNAPAMQVLSSLRRIGVYVIAGDTAGQDDEKPRSDLKRPWAMVRRAAGLGDLRIHDLRHNFGGFGAGGGIGLPLVGRLLGHTVPATTARYAHFDNDPVRKASNTIGAALAAALGEPVDPEKQNNVVSMPGGRRAG